MSRTWCHPRGEMWARSSGSMISPACFRCLTACAEMGGIPVNDDGGEQAEPGHSVVLALTRAVAYFRPNARCGTRSSAGYAPSAVRWRARQLLRLGMFHLTVTHSSQLHSAVRKGNRLSHTQPASFPLAYDSAHYRNRPEDRYSDEPKWICRPQPRPVPASGWSRGWEYRGW